MPRAALVVLGCTLVLACGRARAPVAPLGDPDPAYRALTVLLADHARVDSIADLLPLLDPELLSNFTLAYDSRSPQRPDVDPRHPRVILFGHDARLVLAFTGEGHDRDVLDVLHFRDAARRFELERFVLPAAARRDPALAKLARDNGHPDPVECRRCHGTDPRPIFDSYRVWPGFYGSVDDRLAPGTTELADYRAFLDHVDGVYRLLRFPENSEVSPYELTSTTLAGDAFAPNTRFGMALSELGRERVARQLAASPAYARDRDKLLSGLLGCEAMPLTDGDRARVREAIVAEDRAKLDRAHITDAAKRDDLRMAELIHLENLTELDYVARALDLDISDWSFAIEPAARSLFDGVLSGDVVDGDRRRDFYFKEDVVFEMLGASAKTDVRLAPFFVPRPYVLRGRAGTRLDVPRARQACPVLVERTREVAWPAAPAPAPSVAWRCVRCHEPGGEGPEIPFASPRRLDAALAARPALASSIEARISPHDRRPMPLDGVPLAAGERDALLAYVHSAVP